MKAVIYDKKSKDDRLIYCDQPDPVPGEYELLIEVHASSINGADYRMMQMGSVPKRKIYGADISGVVALVGSKVTKFRVGDDVVGDLSDFGMGGFAEYAIGPEDSFIIKPYTISFTDVAAVPLAGTTALQAFPDYEDIKKGSEILIIGCSGGVGSYAIQLAKYFGMKITGVCSSSKVDMVKELGADVIIDYTREDFLKSDKKYDLILGLNGNYPLRAVKNLLKSGGEYVVVGGAIGQIMKALFFGKILSGKSRKIKSLSAKSNTVNLKYVTQLVEEGVIKPVIDKIFPLKDVSEAFKYIDDNHPKGKVVIQVKE